MENLSLICDKCGKNTECHCPDCNGLVDYPLIHEMEKLVTLEGEYESCGGDTTPSTL